jgi:hypothetical protein
LKKRVQDVSSHSCKGKEKSQNIFQNSFTQNFCQNNQQELQLGNIIPDFEPRASGHLIQLYEGGRNALLIVKGLQSFIQI